MSKYIKGHIPWNKGKTFEEIFGTEKANEIKKLISNHTKEVMNRPEVIKKIKIANTGQKRSNDTRKKLSNLKKGKKRKPLSDVIKKKISIANMERKAWNKGLTKETDERIKKGSEKLKGRKLSERTKNKIREKTLFQFQNYKGPYKDTKPELKMEEILIFLNIPYEKQYCVGSHLADFHFLNTNVLVEVDGDYWHGNPKIYSKLNEIQLKQKERDIKNEQLAKENGFIVLRFWESDILNNKNIIVKELMKVKVK